MADASFGIISVLYDRFMQIVSAPLTNQDILWFALPLAIATIFMTLYFGKYREELGWESAFENTMIFIFVAIDVVREIYYSSGEGSWANLFNNSFYSSISITLLIMGIIFMIIAYYRLLPKKWAFFVFNYAPMNVTLYVVMAVVYTNVAADWITLVAGGMLFALLYSLLRGIQWLEAHAGKEEGIEIIHEKKPGDLAEKFKRKTEELKRKKEIEELKKGTADKK